jgi:metal-sulfur cluster biosynthetic enzyme
MRNLITRIVLVVIVCAIGVLLYWLPHHFIQKRMMKSKFIVSEHIFQSDSALTKENIVEVLKGIIDPELDINLIDLGLINDIQITNHGKVIIRLLLTTTNCPVIKELQATIKESVKKIPKVSAVEVILDKQTTWTPARMTEQGKRQFLNNLR